MIQAHRLPAPAEVSRKTGQRAKPPPRTAVVAIAALIAVAFAGSVMVTPLYPLYQRAFGFGTLMLTFVYATYVVGNLGSLLFFGRLSDRVGRRPLSIAALVVAACSAVLFILASATGWLFAARLLSGLAVGVASGTATAWLTELYGPAQRARATLIATFGNMAGVAVGPLVSGLLAQYAPWPLGLSFVVYLLVLAVTALAIARTPETVPRRDARLTQTDFMPRIAVPAEIRGRFVSPAITVFGVFALGGFYFALIPSLLRQSLGESNLSVAGFIVAEVAVAAILGIASTTRLASVRAMNAGLVLLIPAVGMLVAAQALASIAVLLLGSALAGAALGVGYRGSLQVTNEIAPDDRRAAVTSAYFLATFVGNSVPIIGVGVLSALSTPIVASAAFAATIAAFAIVALIAARKYSSA